MVNLTFGEQVKIVLNRKGMTIKDLAELMEQHTGRKMSRQNLTQRLGRDNFQEQDMRLIAKILGCPFQLSILTANEPEDREEAVPELEPTELEIQRLVKKRFEREERAKEQVTDREALASERISEEDAAIEREVTLEDLTGTAESVEARETESDENPEAVPEEDVPVYGETEIPAYQPEMTQTYQPEPHFTNSVANMFKGFRRAVEEAAVPEKKEPAGDINPYTRKEYATNSVRMHPKRIGYVQVYDRADHKWTDMTEWAFLGYQERKKKLLGKDYIPPTYLD